MGFTSDSKPALGGGRIFISLVALAGWNYYTLTEFFGHRVGYVWQEGMKGAPLFQEDGA